MKEAKLYRYLPILLVVAFLFASCNSGSNSAAVTDEHDNPTTHAEVDEDHHHSENDALELNNGEKWMLDSMTNVNFRSLQQITAKYPEVATSPEQMEKYSEDVREGISQLVKDCSMKGADHEALHAWLNPVIRQMTELTKVDDAETGAKVYDSLRRQIKIFDKYFNVE